MLKETFPNLNTVFGVKDISEADAANFCGGRAPGESSVWVVHKNRRGQVKTDYDEPNLNQDRVYKYAGRILSISAYISGDEVGGVDIYKSHCRSCRWIKAGHIDNGDAKTFRFNNVYKVRYGA